MLSQSSLINKSQSSEQSIVTQPSTETSSSSSSGSGKRKCWTSERFAISAEHPNQRQCLSPNCKKVYSCTTSTTKLRMHWQKHHGERLNTHFEFHDEQHIDAIIKMIIKTQQEYIFAEHPSFKYLMNVMNPRKHLLSRQSISHIIQHKTDEIQAVIVAKLRSTSSIALTFDIWTARKAGPSFVAVSAHYLDESFQSKELLLEFDRLEYPHSGKNIADFLKNVLYRFNLEKKLVGITSDSASNNLNAIKLLRRSLYEDQNVDSQRSNNEDTFIHVRCLAHLINIGVKELLKPYAEKLSNVRSLVTAIKSSSKRTEQFEILQMSIQPDKAPMKLVEDIDIRWNSTFLMLERVLKLQHTIRTALVNFKELSTITIDNWRELEELREFLKPFYRATEWLSAEKKPTISLVIMVKQVLDDHVAKHFNSGELKQSAEKFKHKLKSLDMFVEEESILLVTALDARFKLNLFNQDIKERTKRLLRSNAVAMDDQVGRESPSSGEGSPFDQMFANTVRDEIEHYLETLRIDKSCCPADFWNTNKGSFPLLSKLAQKFLNIQATSVTAERVFSHAGGIDVFRRNKLSDESFRANMVLNSWLQYLDAN